MDQARPYRVGPDLGHNFLGTPCPIRHDSSRCSGSLTVRNRWNRGGSTCPTRTPSSGHYHSLIDPTGFSMLMDIVKGLQADLKKVQRSQAGKRAPWSWDEPAQPIPLTCWGMKQKDTWGGTAHVWGKCLWTPKACGNFHQEGDPDCAEEDTNEDS